jgi:hypothetical protein
MNTKIQKQDELAIEAMSDELRSLIYYGLCALRVDLDRTEISASLYSMEPTVKGFRTNVKNATDTHIEYMKNLAERIKQPLSLVNSFAVKS